LLAALTNGTIWRLGIIFLLAAMGFYGYSFWAPLVISSLTNSSNLAVGLILAAISGATIVCMLLNSAHSDRNGEHALHVAVPLLLMGAGFVGCALLQSPTAAILSLALVPIGHCGAYGPFWSIPSRFLSGTAAAGGIALVATIANVGGFLGPVVIGVLKERTGTHTAAFLLLALLGSLAAFLAFQLRNADVLRRSDVSHARSNA
jgi:ACS family tartrate transporter-like MFS transporter